MLLLERLDAAKITVSVAEGRLKLSAPRGALDPQLVEDAREARDELLPLLANCSCSQAGTDSCAGKDACDALRRELLDWYGDRWSDYASMADDVAIRLFADPGTRHDVKGVAVGIERYKRALLATAHNEPLGDDLLRYGLRRCGRCGWLTGQERRYCCRCDPYDPSER